MKAIMILLISALSAATAAETTASAAGSGQPASDSSAWTSDEQPDVKTVNLPLGNNCSAKISIADGHGEPVSGALTITGEIKRGSKVIKKLDGQIRACEFGNATFDAEKFRLVLKFKTTKVIAGSHKCVTPDSADFPIPAACK